MSEYRRRDCCYSPTTGLLHTVLATPTQLLIDGLALANYGGAYHVRQTVDPVGVVWTIAAHEAGVTLFRWHTVQHVFSGAYGFGMSALRVIPAGVEVYFQGPNAADDTCEVSIYDTMGTLLRTERTEYAAMGFLDVEPNGTIISANRPPITINSVKLWTWTARGGYVVGQSEGGDTIHGSIALVDPASALMVQLGQDIQLPARVSVSPGGSVAVAISGYDTPEPDAVAWEPWLSYVPPVTLPPITIGPQRAIWRGSLSGVVQGNCGNEPTAQYLIEDARWIQPADEPRLLAVFADTKNTSAGIDLTIQVAGRNYVPVVLDDDGDIATAERLHQRFTQVGLRVMRAKQLYPVVNESLADYEARIALNVPVCVLRPLYTAGGTWPEVQVAECNLALDRLIAANPHVIMDLGFGLDRQPSSQWCADYFRQLVTATPGIGPALRREPPPVVPPPVVPPVVPPPTKPPRPIGSLAKLVIALKLLFRRRKK